MQYITEAKRFQQLAGIITEVEETKTEQAIDNLVQKVEKSGKNIEDENVQLDILDKAIDSNFNFTKINPEQITEYKNKANLKEIEGAIASSIEVLENAEIIEKIAHSLNVKSEIIKKAIGWVKYIFKWPFDVIQKFFYKIARFFGASIEKSMIVGVSGLALFAVICLVYGLMHFPDLVANISGGFGIIALIKLAFSLIKSGSSIFSLWKNVTSAKEEYEDIRYTTTDFFNDIESKYKETQYAQEFGKKIPTNWVFKFKEWYDHIKNKEDKQNTSKLLKTIADNINTDTDFTKQHNDLLNIVKKNKNDINIITMLNNIKTAFDLKRKGIEVKEHKVDIINIVNESLEKFRKTKK